MSFEKEFKEIPTVITALKGFNFHGESYSDSRSYCDTGVGEIKKNGFTITANARYPHYNWGVDLFINWIAYAK